MFAEKQKKIDWVTQDRTLENLSEKEREIVKHLVNARHGLKMIWERDLFEYDDVKCKECGITAKHPKRHWQADQACSAAYGRIERALSSFGARRCTPEDFEEDSA